jgi:hypothetical protein
MFANHCTACARRELIFPSMITAVVNDEQGILVRYTCWCGSAQTLRTGAAAQSTADAAVDPRLAA